MHEVYIVVHCYTVLVYRMLIANPALSFILQLILFESNEAILFILIVN